MRIKIAYLLLLCCVVVNVYGQKKSQNKFVEPPTYVCGPVAGSDSTKTTTKPCEGGI